jgi:hypothetical protein
MASFARVIRSTFQFSFKIWARTQKLTSLFCQASQRRTFARIARNQPKKNSITVQLVDGTTKNRFPDEWKSNKNK